MSDKLSQLNALVEKRKSDRYRMPPNAAIGDFHGGIYDQHNYISPWSISAHNLDADIVIFLQDWTSQDAINKGFDQETLELGYTPHLPSNKNLIKLLSETIKKPISEIYISNLFVFVKPKGMSSAIPTHDMDYSTINYAIPQLDIIHPKMVICLGLGTYNALRRALGHKNTVLSEGLRLPAIEHGKAKIFGVSHTGARGVSNAGGFLAVKRQWETLAKIYTEINQDY